MHRIVLGLAPGDLVQQLDRDDSLINSTDSQAYTPLHYAALCNHVEAVRILLDRGAEPGIADREDRTPLHLAIACGHWACAKILLEKGASVMARDWLGQSALHYTSSHSESSESFEMAHLLIQKGADINAANQYGCTPLHMTTYCYDNTKIAGALLSSGADIEACDHFGYTPVMAGIERNAIKSMELLLQEGARLDHVTSLGRNALHMAALWGNYHILNLLLHVNLEGVDPRACDEDGYTPLDCFNKIRGITLRYFVEGVTKQEEWRVFKALLVRAGYSPVEELDSLDYYYGADDEDAQDEVNNEENEDDDEGNGDNGDDASNGGNEGDEGNRGHEGNEDSPPTTNTAKSGDDIESEAEIFLDAESELSA